MRVSDEMTPKLLFCLTVSDFTLNCAKRSRHLLIIPKPFKCYHFITTCAKCYCRWSIRSIWGGLRGHIICTGLLECVGSSSRLLWSELTRGQGKAQKKTPQCSNRKIPYSFIVSKTPSSMRSFLYWVSEKKGDVVHGQLGIQFPDIHARTFLFLFF